MPAKGGRRKSFAFQLPAELHALVLLHVISHPFRYGILKELTKGNPLYINQLRRRLGVSRRMVAFHLMDLEKFKLVETYLDYLPGGKARKRAMMARFARITAKGRKSLAGIDEALRLVSGQ